MNYGTTPITTGASGAKLALVPWHALGTQQGRRVLYNTVFRPPEAAQWLKNCTAGERSNA